MFCQIIDKRLIDNQKECRLRATYAKLFSTAGRKRHHIFYLLSPIYYLKKAYTMYHPFFQFVLPRLGQAALDILLYLNFLQLPPLAACGTVAGSVLRPAAGADGHCWPISAGTRSGLGIVFVGHLVTFYCIGTGIGLALRRIGGTPLAAWHIFWLGGITPWLLTAPDYVVGAGAGRCTSVRPATALRPAKSCRAASCASCRSAISTPEACAAMDHTRIPELREKIEACHPDLLVLTGDIFDEFTEPEELKAFCALFGALRRAAGQILCAGQP